MAVDNALFILFCWYRRSLTPETLVVFRRFIISVHTKTQVMLLTFRPLIFSLTRIYPQFFVTSGRRWRRLPPSVVAHRNFACDGDMFLPLDIPSEYRPEHVTFGLLCVIFKFPSRIFCRRVPGFATDCPCGVWCRGLTTCLLYVGPPLEF